MNNDDDNEKRLTPPDALAAAARLTTNNVPTTSARQYEKHYEAFQDYLKSHGGLRKATVENVNAYYVWLCEEVLDEDAGEVRERFAASSRATKMSALKTMLFAKEGFSKQSVCWEVVERMTADAMKRHDPKQSNVIDEAQLIKFFINAPSTDKYLVIKTVVSLQIALCARFDSIYTLLCSNVIAHDDGGYKIMFNHVKQVQSVEDKTKEIGPHVPGQSSAYHPTQWLKQYLDARDAAEAQRDLPEPLFLQIRNNKMTEQRVGVKNMQGFYGEIAEWLQLPQPKSYTSHGVRRFAATNASDHGASTTQLQQLGGWRNPAMPVRYAAQSKITKRHLSDLATGSTTRNATASAVSRAMSTTPSHTTTPSTSTAWQPTSLSSTSASTSIQQPSVGVLGNVFGGAVFNGPTVIHIMTPQKRKADNDDDSQCSDNYEPFAEFEHIPKK